MISNLWTKAIPLSVACVLALALSLHASPFSYWRDDGSGEWQYAQYVDFGSSTLPDHEAYDTFTFDSPHPNVKYSPLQIFSETSNNDNGSCIEIITRHPEFYPGVIADTRIWFWNQNTNTYQSLNDDYDGSRFSRGRVYVKGFNSFVNTYIAAYNSSHNSDHFALVVRRLNLTEAACTTGQTTVPWVKSVNDVMTVSPNAR
jgi:hypothetical protein